MDVIWQVCMGLGLSCAAGLNAYVPLLVVGILGAQGSINLEGYDVLGRSWCIGVMMGLILVEMVLDKISGVDHVNDAIQMVVRPAAGGVLFGIAMSGAEKPAVWVVLGVVCAGAVHISKVWARRRINVRAGILGAPLVSLVEDLVATVVTMTSVLVPGLGVVMVGVFGVILWRMYGRFFGKGRVVKVLAVRVGSS